MFDLVTPLRDAAYLAFEDGTNDYTTAPKAAYVLEAQAARIAELEASVVPLDTPESHKLKADAGIPHLPTQLTYDCRNAISGNGPLAYTWEDKPHRLVYDLCREIERIAAIAALGGKDEPT